MTQMRTYPADRSAVFCKTTERFGLLSNLASGLPVPIAGHMVSSSEALYQAMRFPDDPALQAEICALPAYQSKKFAHAQIARTRADWVACNVRIMAWCLRLKLASNRDILLPVLDQTADMPIVELSWRDAFWGARPLGNLLQGRNVLGRLWMDVRQAVSEGRPGTLENIQPPDMREAMLFGEEIGVWAPTRVLGSQLQLEL